MARVGLMAQRQVIEVLNHYFVPFEFDATHGIPDGVEALALLRKSWNEIPWTRVSFGSEYVLDPEGNYVLSSGFSKHHHAIRKGREFAPLFQRALEESLERFARIRAHERGSAAEQQELRGLSQQIRRDVQARRPCSRDVDLFTDCTLRALWGGDAERFEKRLSGVFRYPDPAVRSQLAATLGRYADRSGIEFRSSEDGLFIGERVARLLADSDVSVRHAAAVAIYQFVGHSVPAAEDSNFVADARNLWSQRTADRR